jgi:hypothetical protein
MVSAISIGCGSHQPFAFDSKLKQVAEIALLLRRAQRWLQRYPDTTGCAFRTEVRCMRAGVGQIDHARC